MECTAPTLDLTLPEALEERRKEEGSEGGEDGEDGEDSEDSDIDSDVDSDGEEKSKEKPVEDEFSGDLWFSRQKEATIAVVQGGCDLPATLTFDTFECVVKKPGQSEAIRIQK